MFLVVMAVLGSFHMEMEMETGVTCFMCQIQAIVSNSVCYVNCSYHACVLCLHYFVPMYHFVLTEQS